MKKITNLWYVIGGIGTLLVATSIYSVLYAVPQCGGEVLEAPYAVVVGAFDLEVDAVLQNIERTGECKNNGIVYYQASYHDIPLLVFESGMGLTLAEQTTDSTLSNFNVTQLVFSGIAGSADSTLPLGSVAVAREWLDSVNKKRFRIDASLVEKAEGIETVHVVDRGASFGAFVTDVRSIPEGVQIVDLETSGIARSAQKYQVPFIAFRGISDIVGEESSDELFQQAASNSAEAVLSFLSDKEVTGKE